MSSSSNSPINHDASSREPSAASSADDRPALLGGNPSCDFAWPNWPIHDKSEERALLEVLHSGKWWFGDRVSEFEEKFAEFQGAQYAVTCTNGTTAIEMALRALGVVHGDEVIVPPYTFIATASAVVNVGAIPVFADILPNTLCLDPVDCERKITRRTRAIIPVHVSGIMADMEQINTLAQKHDLIVMEDAAHAWGSQWNGQGAGTFGRCGTFSFQETKNLTAGEGGILVTNDSELAEMCRSFTHCGRTKGSAWYDHNLLGSNLRMTEFQAAILLAQLTRLANQVARREKAAAQIDETLSAFPCIKRLSPTPQMSRRSYHMQIFRVDESSLGMSRDRLIEALNAEGVPVSAGWYRPLYGNHVFQTAHVGPAHGIRSPLADAGVDYRDVNCPVCEQVCRDAIWIPHFVLLADDGQIDQLCNTFRKVIAAAPALAEIKETKASEE